MEETGWVRIPVLKIEDRSSSGPQVVPKWSPSGPQVVPKWSSTGPQKKSWSRHQYRRAIMCVECRGSAPGPLRPAASPDSLSCLPWCPQTCTLRLTVRVDQSVQLLLDYGAKAVYAIVGRAIASGVRSNKVGAHHTGVAVAVAVSPARARATSIEKVSAERKPYWSRRRRLHKIA